MSRPFFSIVTVNFNNLMGLRETVNSVSIQSNTNYELIVIDGGSIDGSCGLIEESDVVTKYLIEKDRGIADAFNKGLALCQGRYICFLNSGDLFAHSEVLSCVESSLIRQPKEWAYGYRKRVGVNGEIFEPRQSEMIAYDREKYFLGKLCISHQAAFFDLEVAKQQMYDERYQMLCMDIDFIFRFACRGEALELGQSIVLYDECGISSKYVVKCLWVKWGIAKKYNKSIGLPSLLVDLTYMKTLIRTFFILRLKGFMGLIGFHELYRKIADYKS